MYKNSNAPYAAVIN